MPPRYSGEDREQAMSEVRQRLMEAAIEDFAQNGYAGANVNSISLSAGFAKGTIYNYFPSKQDLMFAVLEEAGKAHFDSIAGRIRQENDPGRRVECFFEAGFAFVAENPARGQVLVSTLYGTQVEFKTHLYKVYQPLFQLVAEEILAPGIAQGFFRQMNPDDVSLMIMTFYLGTVSSFDASGTSRLDLGETVSFVLHAIQNTTE